MISKNLFVSIIAFLVATQYCIANPLIDSKPQVINDITQLNPITVSAVSKPKTVEELAQVIKTSTGSISIGGGRYSQGGQTAYPNSLHLDMTHLNKVISLDTEKKEIKVQAGIRWRDLQEYIDPHNLSVKIMQSYANFTIGGTLSVNAHGRYVGKGPVINSVKEITLVLANGEIMRASRSENYKLFYSAIGGYGGIGVIAEAVLELVDNKKITRKDRIISTEFYKDYFIDNIRDNPKAVFSNGDIYPPSFSYIRSITWYETNKNLTEPLRLIPRNKSYYWEPKVIDWIADYSSGLSIRRHILDPLIYTGSPVVWRNYEASYDVRELEPKSRTQETYGLREYFIPVESFELFVGKLRSVVAEYKINIINVSVRHSPMDDESLLSWAPTEIFSFVIYYRQNTSKEEIKHVGNWTRALNDSAIALGGTYYLPYQVHETTEQFNAAYPRHIEFFTVKKQYDPEYRFRNILWERHYNPLQISTPLPTTTPPI